MEAAAVFATVRGVSLPVPSSQPSRKEWRAVSEHSGNPIRNNMLNDSMDLGTPIAPPIMDIGGEGSKKGDKAGAMDVTANGAASQE
ncbi:hypothetical protein F0562_017721 [Nyssa sinensis]|uniref:Uncharacterized protein n=1 Tax=Nyssa sinensis TaxID=561372 RepID=A0A5J4ZIS9_9ASTE|nr:hypothetical protein F0562_017721 [Nyssa sinensis]